MALPGLPYLVRSHYLWKERADAKAGKFKTNGEEIWTDLGRTTEKSFLMGRTHVATCIAKARVFNATCIRTVDGR